MITQQASFWIHLTERYFEADLTEYEESILKRFLASDVSSDQGFSKDALSLFVEVRAVMSLTTVGRGATSYNHNMNTISSVPGKKKSGITQMTTKWRWIAGIAASIIIALVIVLFKNSREDGIYRALVNGNVITDKEQVLTLMLDSWDDIDIQLSSDEVELQMKEMFNGME